MSLRYRNLSKPIREKRAPASQTRQAVAPAGWGSSFGPKKLIGEFAKVSAMRGIVMCGEAWDPWSRPASNLTKNQTIMIRSSLIPLALLLGAGASQAALTYVDANFATNTSPNTAVTTVVAQDNLWAQRGFGTNTTVFESSGNTGAENSPILQTIITGLVPGVAYNVWVNFYDVQNDSTQNWPIRAGFTTGDLTLYANGADGGAAALSATAAGLASDLTYVSNPRFDDGSGRMLYAGALGSAVASVDGGISVFIDDMPATIGSNNRTWYDGVSYEIVPEPTTALLAAFGGVALLRRRR